MPRRPQSEGHFTFNVVLQRHYLRTSTAESGEAVFHDAFHCMEVGAVELIAFCLMLRANPRTRRTMQEVRLAWRQAVSPGAPVPPRWYTALQSHVYHMMRVMHRSAFPVRRAVAPGALTHRLSRQLRRMLGPSGLVRAELPTLRAQAAVAVRDLQQELVGQTAVVWVDNWYWERYGTNPATPTLSQDVTVFGVLLLSSTTQGPATSTRSHFFSPFGGQLSFHHLTLRPANVAGFINVALGKMLRTVTRLAEQPLQGGWIRVPLDVHRPDRRSLQWRSLMLSQMRVSCGGELLHVLEDVRQLQQHVGLVLPLLVDEKIHYSVCRLMYSRSYSEYNVTGWLHHIPLLYGVWHPYKQTLHLTYRRFFPLFGLLETTGEPRLGARVPCYRKVLFVEKVCAALLLAAHPLRGPIEEKLAVATADTSHCSSAKGPSLHHPLRQPFKLIPFHWWWYST